MNADECEKTLNSNQIKNGGHFSPFAVRRQFIAPEIDALPEMERSIQNWLIYHLLKLGNKLFALKFNKYFEKLKEGNAGYNIFGPSLKHFALI